MAKRVLIVDILAATFGIGSWVCLIGVFVELPLLVPQLPEGWALPSYFQAVSQLSNIGPAIFLICNHYFPEKARDKPTIYGVLCLGIVTTFLLSFYWDFTAFVFGAERSVGAIVLVFFVGMVDCSSRVLYPPFMSRFHPTYLGSYFIGEGLSGFIPSLLALIQGVGEPPVCIETLNNFTGNSTYEFQSNPPIFSVEAFFFCLLAMFVVTGIAFHLLQYDCLVKGALAEAQIRMEVENGWICDDGENTVPTEKNQPAQIPLDVLSNNCDPSTLQAEIESANTDGDVIYLLIVQAVTNCVLYGFLICVQSYSCLPYGTTVYHLTVTLTNIANPVLCLILQFGCMPKPTRSLVTWLTAVGMVLSSYAGLTAFMSPNPPLVGTLVGEVILVMTWILLCCAFTYSKVAVATLLLQLRGKQGLFWCGAASQTGNAIGSIGTFCLINFTEIFESYYESCP